MAIFARLRILHPYLSSPIVYSLPIFAALSFETRKSPCPSYFLSVMILKYIRGAIHWVERECNIRASPRAVDSIPPSRIKVIIWRPVVKRISSKVKNRNGQTAPITKIAKGIVDPAHGVQPYATQLQSPDHLTELFRLQEWIYRTFLIRLCRRHRKMPINTQSHGWNRRSRSHSQLSSSRQQVRLAYFLQSNTLISYAIFACCKFSLTSCLDLRTSCTGFPVNPEFLKNRPDFDRSKGSMYPWQARCAILHFWIASSICFAVGPASRPSICTWVPKRFFIKLLSDWTFGKSGNPGVLPMLVISIQSSGEGSFILLSGLWYYWNQS